ncbi:MAG TPA: WhiB family transcriptional regulator [Actinobacteria bacterium]|nr:WhiB family transcriptional regulator [Actinomycetota bacterium]
MPGLDEAAPTTDRDWRAAAACAGAPLDLFFPESDLPEAAAAALAVCATCDVREACLAFALATNQTEGIWGGMTADERRRLRRRLRDRRRRLAS